MKRATTILAALLGASALLGALGAPARAAQPWWQLLSGSRPSNLQVAPDQSEVQEVSAATASVPKRGQVLAATVEVGGEPVGCLGAGALAFFFCPEKTGFPATETRAGFQEMLEAVPSYAAGGAVEVSGPANVGEGPLRVTTPGRWAPSLGFSVPSFSSEGKSYALGSASAQVTSEGSGRLAITLTNLGDARLDATKTPLEITDSLPHGVAAYAARGEAGGPKGGQGSAGPVACALPSVSEVSCSFEGVLPPYEAIEVEVFVAVSDGASGAGGEVAVSGGRGPGGEAAPTVREPQTLNLSDAPVPFGLEHFSVRAEEEGGAQTLAAGAHPFQLTTTIVANSGPQEEGADRSGKSARVLQPAMPRNLRFALPAGLVADLTALPTCPMAVFLQRARNGEEKLVNECPDEAAIGVSSISLVDPTLLGLGRLAVPVFNLPPGPGEPARFGLMAAGDPVVIDTSVDPSDSYRAVAEVRNITQLIQFLGSTTTLWGVPGDPAHDASRGWNCAYFGAAKIPGECPAEPREPRAPFLRMPVFCASPLHFDAAIEPWNVPPGSARVPDSFESPPLRACNALPFDPTLSAAPTSGLASNPSGLDLGIQMPGKGLDNPAPGAVSETQFKRAEVILPKGLTVNPSIAEGLAVCSEAEYEAERYDSGPGEGCPEASKIGSVQIRTPLLTEEATGAVYQATPYENPTQSLIGLYLVARIPARGIVVKQPIEVRPDPVSGQLVSIAKDVPQLPFSSFSFHFREGGRSPLITPPGCGTFHTTARFVPYSAANPDDPAPSEVVERRASFTVGRGVDGGACPSGHAPFHPGFEAGTLNNQAGSYSPFVMHLTRQDGEQDMGRFSFVLPPGVVGKLAGIPYCPEAGIARAKARQGAHGGQEEIDDPSCPAASQIGTTIGGAGVGNQLTYVKGKLYLAGPWHGDPLSVVAITPAVAGPFDAGTVVVREALRLNPVSARAEVDGAASDPIPHILKGIPLNLRDLRVYADKPDFTLNATSCEPFKAESTIWGDGTALEPLAQTPVELSSRYQAAGCASLGFKPRLAIRLYGGTKRGAHPALRAIVRPRPGQANFSRAAVTLPHSAFLDQGHIRTICTRVQFAAGAGHGSQCPKGARYGYAKAWSPLLDGPATGPVYLRSSNHNLPDLVVALKGPDSAPVDVELASRIDSVRGGIRSIFTGIPDVPVSRFVLAMQGGKKGLIVNSRNLCYKPGKNKAKANLLGQNGRVSRTKPRVVSVTCAKRRKAKRRHKKAHRSHARRAARAVNRR